MAKILPFRPDAQTDTRQLRCFDVKILNFVPIRRTVVINRTGTTVTVRFPRAWLPFVRWPEATSLNR